MRVVPKAAEPDQDVSVHLGQAAEGDIKGKEPQVGGEYWLVEQCGKRVGEEPKQ
jgi:hypothetical protein